jgi:glycerate-2-kinase
VSPGLDSRARLEVCFRAALTAVDAGAAVTRALVRDGPQLRIAGDALPAAARLIVLAVGKAAAPMAAAVEAVAGERIAAGLVVTKDGHGDALVRMPLREAAHPIPDARSERAAREALALVAGAGPDDVLLVLLSGGASSLLTCPAPGLAQAELAAVTQLLLSAGADIEELNTVRKHLSAVAGGRLAQQARCQRIELLVVSDVPGDRLDVIGSGLLSADPSRYGDALAVVERCGVRAALPARVLAHLEAGAAGRLVETPKPGDPLLARVRAHVLASNATARSAALAAARAQAALAFDLGGGLRGEASTAGTRLAALSRALRSDRRLCLVVGGETTVRVRGPGQGGRNQELALAAALALAGDARATLLAAGTDGSDGLTSAAGAFADGGTLERARRLGLDARAALARNDSGGFFCAEGGRFVTGPTRSNVMDLALLWFEPGSA